VGGHCVGVDPYYLTHKAQEVGYYPEVILAGRRVNDNMGEYIAGQVIRLMNQAGITVGKARVLVMGLAFKENCPDLRNTRVIDMIEELQTYHTNVDVYDPWVNPDELEHEYGIRPIPTLEKGKYDAIILAVAHDQFKAMSADDIRALGKSECVLFDVKHVLPVDKVDDRL